jgi:hypothetical protein
VAAGNPARVVKQLDPQETFTTRADFFSDPVNARTRIHGLGAGRFAGQHRFRLAAPPAVSRERGLMPGANKG